MAGGIARAYRAVLVVYACTIVHGLVVTVVFLGAAPLGRGAAGCLWGALVPRWADTACAPGGYALPYLGASAFAILCAYVCRHIVADILAVSGQKKIV